MDVSSVAAAVTAQSMSQVQDRASMLMLRKTLDLSRQQSDALVALIDQTHGLGQNLNVTA